MSIFPKKLFTKKRNATAESTSEDISSGKILGANKEERKEKEKIFPSETSDSFSQSIRCFQLKRDIEQMLDIQWVAENCNYNKEQPPASNMEVHSMSEFLERLQQDDYQRRAMKGEQKPRVRRYELVDKRNAMYVKRKR